MSPAAQRKHGLLNASDGGEDAAIGHLYMLARTFRQILSVDAAKRGAGPEVIMQAFEALEPELALAVERPRE